MSGEVGNGDSNPRFTPAKHGYQKGISFGALRFCTFPFNWDDIPGIDDVIERMCLILNDDRRVGEMFISRIFGHPTDNT